MRNVHEKCNEMNDMIQIIHSFFATVFTKEPSEIYNDMNYMNNIVHRQGFCATVFTKEPPEIYNDMNYK